ncbi:MAG: helix-turn-helix transcriptional regulator [Victivallales bacterium]|nr:helix-turn-helix transcriptional regulator [Victivallales bacterium]
MEENRRKSLEILKHKGVMDEVIVQWLKELLLEQMLTRYDAAHLLGVCVATLYKWETGRSHRCGLRARLTLSDFLEGNLPELPFAARERGWEGVSACPEEVLQCMEHIEKVYEMCSAKPSLRHAFVTRLEREVNDCVALKLDGEQLTGELRRRT